MNLLKCLKVNMKKLMLLSLLMLAAGSMSAQSYSQGEDPKVIKM